MSVYIFYTDETGDAALGTVPESDPPMLKPSHSHYFTLAAVGIRDSARGPLAGRLVELKGRYLLRGVGEASNMPSGSARLATRRRSSGTSRS